VFGAVFLFVIFALGHGHAALLARGVAGRTTTRALKSTAYAAAASAEAAHDVLRLKYLGGGHGEGCNNEDDRFTLWRRRFHHFTFYGFMLCFASTSVATLYHYFFGLQAPYALTSLPVLLGTAGGIGLVIGPSACCG
jgi:citrate/tricarballylate utilization protein